MSETQLTISDIVSWFRSRESMLEGSGVHLTEVHEHHQHLPSAAADFDSFSILRCFGERMGRTFSFGTKRPQASTGLVLRAPAKTFSDTCQTPLTILT
jgi:hypothetical protein